MRVLQHDESTGLIGEPTPGAAVWGVVSTGNPLMDGAAALRHGAPRVVLHSGRLGGDGLAGDIATWSPPGMSALDSFCDVVGPLLIERGQRALFMPHHAHVLSDVQRCVKFLLARREQPFGIVLRPLALLASSMLARAEDHLRRCLETLGPMCDALWLETNSGDADPRGVEDDGEARTGIPASRGTIDSAAMFRLVGAYVGPDTTVIVAPADLGALMASRRT